jgi:hypothetical protein
VALIVVHHVRQYEKMIQALRRAQQMAHGAGVHRQILVGGGSERTAHGR